MSAEITGWSASRIAGEVGGGRVRARAVAEAFLARIRRVDPRVRAFVCVLEKEALEAADAVDRKIAAGTPVGPLCGVPIALKDNMMLRGAATTCSSRILEGYVAPYDATVVGRLKAADAVILGKTNLDEFAMGSSTENSAFFPTRNPWDLSRVPGGSSGGSAAAVAARMVPLALGSDTGGSIRQPAALCGVVGLKPTYGRVSRYGLVAFASSLDQIGPFAATIEDAALALSVIAGGDPRDSTSADAPAPRASLADGGLKGLTVGLPEGWLDAAGVDPRVRTAVERAVETFRELGASIVPVRLPSTKYAVSTYYILAPSEASANLARFDGVRYGHSIERKGGDGASLLEVYETSRAEGFGPEVKRRIMLGTYALSSGYYDAFYGKAQRVRTLIKREFDEAFRAVDLIVSPTSPTAAFKLGEKTSDPLQMYLADIYTIPCNIAGGSGISIPCELTDGGLPVGLQLMGRPLEEDRLLAAAKHYESARPFPILDEVGG